jgi:hypothetical protein
MMVEQFQIYPHRVSLCSNPFTHALPYFEHLGHPAGYNVQEKNSDMYDYDRPFFMINLNYIMVLTDC